MLLFIGAVSHEALNLKNNWNLRTTRICICFAVYFLLTNSVGVYTGITTLADSSWLWNLIIDFYPQPVKWALLEEIIFRGILQTWLSVRLATVRRSEFFAILLTALLFGIYHYPFLYTSWYKAAFLGFIFGWSYSKTKNLWVPIILHSLNNLIIHSIFVPQ